MIFCPQCSGKSRIVDTRPDKDGSARRTRACTACGERWWTLETWTGAKPRPKQAPETKVKRRVTRRLNMDNVLARKHGLPVELIGEYRRMMKTGCWKAADAAALLRDHAAKRLSGMAIANAGQSA